jgi:hypothetical protein
MTIANLNNSLFEALDKIRAQCPEMRFGQLIATIGLLAEDETVHSLWDLEEPNSPPPRSVLQPIWNAVGRIWIVKKRKREAAAL